MKTLATTIVLLLSITFYSQSFKASSEYSITNFSTELNAINYNSNSQVELHLYKGEEIITKLTSLTKENLDTFLSVQVEVLENPTLVNVEKVIRVRFEYVAGCSDFETQYFIQSNDGSITTLPTTEFTFCEYATAKIEYIFPSQEFGEANTIIKSNSYLDENKVTDSIFVLEKTVWKETNTTEGFTVAVK